jgi:hypothetical protein
MFADTNALSISVAKVANLEGPEEETVAQDSPTGDGPPACSFNRTTNVLAST